jgi:hypothetical protein
MEDPVNGQVEHGSYTLTGRTAEMEKLEGLFDVVGFEAVMSKVNDCSVAVLKKVAAIVLKSGHPDVSQEEVEAALDCQGHEAFRLSIVRLAASAYGGRDALRRVDRLRSANEAVREAAIREIEEEAAEKRTGPKAVVNASAA